MKTNRQHNNYPPLSRVTAALVVLFCVPVYCLADASAPAGEFSEVRNTATPQEQESASDEITVKNDPGIDTAPAEDTSIPAHTENVKSLDVQNTPEKPNTDVEITVDKETAACIQTPGVECELHADTTFSTPEFMPGFFYRHLENVTIVDSYYASFDSANIPIGRIEESRLPGKNAISVVGELSQRVYSLPDHIPKARAYEFYRNELRNASFEILFTCIGPVACGAGFGHYVNAGAPVVKPETDYIGYAPHSAIAARQATFFGDTYVFIYSGAHDNNRLFEQIVTTNKANEQSNAGLRPAE